MNISAMFKQIMHWVGGLLAFAGVAFVVERLWSSGQHMDLAVLESRAWVDLSILSLIYGSANILLALSWRELLRHFGVLAPRTWAIWAYGVSQIAKYIPGNIFHLAGRQVLGVAAGYPHRVMAISAVWELGVIAVTAAMFGVVVAPIYFGLITPIIGLVIFVVLVLGSLIVVKQQAGLFLSLAMLLHACFLTISAVVFVCVIAVIAPDKSLAFPDGIFFGGAFVLAWLVGLVTPGAPAGIGVRELMLLLLLKGQMSQTDLVMAIALGRIVTSGGDVLFFIATLIYGRKLFFRVGV